MYTVKKDPGFWMKQEWTSRNEVTCFWTGFAIVSQQGTENFWIRLESLKTHHGLLNIFENLIITF
jgi:hypothetical protein